SPAYGGGLFYGGGSTSSYRSGGRSPKGILPFALIGVAATAFIFPGIWLHGAYVYNYDTRYNFRNRTSMQATNESLPVTCLCQQYNPCGCDDNKNATYLDQIIGDGSRQSMNTSLVHIGDVNGTRTVVLNGTLPNGTKSTAPTSTSKSASIRRSVLENSGFWLVGAIVGGIIWLL
ncbi:MAG: hypothetical protein Q9164_002975, partial [Protoblastenia rupestris]